MTSTVIRLLAKALITAPLYHLFVAGPTRACNRTSFILALAYAYVIAKIGMILTTAAIVLPLRFTGFPYQPFTGFTSCRWQMFTHVKDPLYQTLGSQYLASHQTLITTLHLSLQGVAFLTAIFGLWRLYMLILQRAQSSGFPPSWAAAISLGLQLYMMSSSAIFPSMANVLLGLWLLYLAIVPPQATTATSTAAPVWLEDWFLTPFRQTFSLSFSTPLAPKHFILGNIYVFLPLLFVCMGLVIEYVQIKLPAHSFFSVDDSMCNWVLLSSIKPEHNYQTMAAVWRVFFSAPAALGGITLHGLIVCLVFQVLCSVSLIFQRFKHINLPYSAVWATLFCVIAYGVNHAISTVQHNSLGGNLIFYALLALLALIQPFHRKTT